MEESKQGVTRRYRKAVMIEMYGETDRDNELK